MAIWVESLPFLPTAFGYGAVSEKSDAVELLVDLAGREYTRE